MYNYWLQYASYYIFWLCYRHLIQTLHIYDNFAIMMMHACLICFIIIQLLAFQNITVKKHVQLLAVICIILHLLAVIQTFDSGFAQMWRRCYRDDDACLIRFAIIQLLVFQSSIKILASGSLGTTMTYLRKTLAALLL